MLYGAPKPRSCMEKKLEKMSDAHIFIICHNDRIYLKANIDTNVIDTNVLLIKLIPNSDFMRRLC